MTTTPPPEPPDGQDDPPDLATALRAVVRFLKDVRGHLDAEDLELRRGALRAAVERLRDG